MKERMTIVGNVATAPELRRLPAGDAVASFRVAVTERRQDRATSEWVDGHTSWYRVSAFRGLGENVHQSIRVGDRVLVTGKFTLQEWETDAKRGITAEIEAEAVGHDLRWGTTVFARAVSRSGAGAQQGADERQDGASAGSVDESGWAAPGTEPSSVAAEPVPF